MLFVTLLLAGYSGRTSDAIEHAGMTQPRLEAGNLQGARRNMQLALMARDDVGECSVLLGWVERGKEVR